MQCRSRLDRDTDVVFGHCQSTSVLQDMFETDKSGESNLNETIRHLKTISKVLFGDLEETIFFTLKFCMLDHIKVEVTRFETFNILDASPFEHFNYIIKMFIKKTSMRRSKGSTLYEALNLISFSSCRRRMWQHNEMLEKNNKTRPKRFFSCSGVHWDVCFLSYISHWQEWEKFTDFAKFWNCPKLVFDSEVQFSIVRD